MRNKTTPVNPQTSFQQNARSILASQSQAWSGVSQAQRNGWSALAQTLPFTDIFGDPKTLSGQALFVKLNVNLLKIGESAISSAPLKEAVPGIQATALTATVTAGTISALNLTIAPATIPAGFSMVVFATPAINAGVSFVKNQFRQIGVAGAPLGGVIDLETLWNARFGAISAGQKIFIRIALVSQTSGQQGIPAEISAISA
jgi:hypothetical protein